MESECFRGGKANEKPVRWFLKPPDRLGAFAFCEAVCILKSHPAGEGQKTSAKPLPLSQCYQQRVALPNAHGAANFLWDDHSAQIVNAAYNSSCFHL